MEILEAGGDFSFAGIAELIEAEWPRQWKAASRDEMVAEIEASADARYDVNKLLVDGDRIVGWYRYSRWPREESNLQGAHTLDIAVLPGLQGRGYGAMLMRDLVEDCRSRGYRKLMSRTFFDNAASIALHKRTGFAEAFRTEDSIVWEIAL
jgi:phosphinothricin acetyltransferase